MRAVVGFSFLPFFNPKMVYFYPPILPIVYTQVWLQLISNLMWFIIDFTIFSVEIFKIIYLIISFDFRDPIMTPQQRQRSVDSPVEVKEEPFEEDMNEGYEEEYPNEEYEDYGEEDVEGDVDQDFAQGMEN